MKFADELRQKTKYHKSVTSTIELIKAKLVEAAESGATACYNVYRLKEEAVYQHVKTPKLNNEFDTIILSKLTEMGLTFKIVFVDLNPHPSFGEEGFEACFRVDIYW